MDKIYLVYFVEKDPDGQFENDCIDSYTKSFRNKTYAKTYVEK